MRRDIAEMIAGTRPPPNCAIALGGRVIGGADGYFKAEFEATESFYNPANVVQGGFLSAMLDDTMGPAIVTTLAEDEFHSTVDLHIQFVRAATAGILIGEARVTHRGRLVRMAEATLTTPDGSVIALGRCTSVVRKAPPGADPA